MACKKKLIEVALQKIVPICGNQPMMPTPPHANTLGGLNLNNKERLTFAMILTMLLASCAPQRASLDMLPYDTPPQIVSPPVPPALGGEAAIIEPFQQPAAPNVLREDMSYIFVERNTNAADGSVARMFERMEHTGLPLHRTAAAPHGLIARDDVILLKINCQWAETGGTNTDLIRAVAEQIAAHPEGFIGEIVIADNGQAQFGTHGTGGSLDWEVANSLNRDQSTQDVIDALSGSMRISGYLWDTITFNRVNEFSQGDFEDGFVIQENVHGTGLEISYPKFTTLYGTHISFRYGIWNPETGEYNNEQLQVINMPVLKSHMIYGVTGAVKNYMGVVANQLTNFRPHRSVGTGGMGTLMANTRMPALNIMDMVWVGANIGPGALYTTSVQTNIIAASTDAVALDYWAAGEILMPLLNNPAAADPRATESGTFGHWLRLSAGELERYGYRAALGGDDIALIEGG